MRKIKMAVGIAAILTLSTIQGYACDMTKDEKENAEHSQHDIKSMQHSERGACYKT
jgi:hypothetical protein